MEATDWLAIAVAVMVGAERVLALVAPKTGTKWDNKAHGLLVSLLELAALKKSSKE